MPRRRAKIEPIPTHNAFFSRLKLPFQPEQAWYRLPLAAQSEIGIAVIGLALAEYVSSQCDENEKQFVEADLREAAPYIAGDLHGAVRQRLRVLLPALFGSEGQSPAWLTSIER